MKQLLLIISLLLIGKVHSQTYIYVDASNISIKLSDQEKYTPGSWEPKEGVIKVDGRNRVVELTTIDGSVKYKIDDIDMGKSDFILYHLTNTTTNTPYDFHYSKSLCIFWWSDNGLDYRLAFAISKIE